MKAIESPRYVAILTGPRGGVTLVAKGDVKSRVETQGQEAFVLAHRRFERRDTGMPPMWDLYERQRASGK